MNRGHSLMIPERVDKWTIRRTSTDYLVITHVYTNPDTGYTVNDFFELSRFTLPVQERLRAIGMGINAFVTTDLDPRIFAET
jgi:hypothetical protein